MWRGYPPFCIFRNGSNAEIFYIMENALVSAPGRVCAGLRSGRQGARAPRDLRGAEEEGSARRTEAGPGAGGGRGRWTGGGSRTAHWVLSQAGCSSLPKNFPGRGWGRQQGPRAGKRDAGGGGLIRNRREPQGGCPERPTPSEPGAHLLGQARKWRGSSRAFWVLGNFARLTCGLAQSVSVPRREGTCCQTCEARLLGTLLSPGGLSHTHAPQLRRNGEKKDISQAEAVSGTGYLTPDPSWPRDHEPLHLESEETWCQ